MVTKYFRVRGFERWLKGCLGLAIIWAGLGVSAPGAQRVLYQTKFEASEGFNQDLTLIGQGGWVGYGSGGNGLVTGFFSGGGQHAFIGFGAPTNNGDFLNVWRPVAYVPGPTNPPIVRFSVLMQIEDSATVTNRDDFRWSVYNGRGDRLFTLDFDNDALGINYLLDNNSFVSTGKTFTNAVPYRLEVVMNFQANQWSSTLDGQVLTDKLAITTRASPLDFGDMDAVWAIRTPGKPGDNFLVFDDYLVVAEDGQVRPPPTLTALGLLRPGQFLLRCAGTAGVRYVIQGSADLAVWFPLKTNTMPTDASFDFLDQSGVGARLYRAMELP
ncbi:MAG: hypothetical protein JNK85_25900 [Verrucomicrobiales bacterium]|nr:hypothetical protein [Verrucomicrobiales bacterium]